MRNLKWAFVALFLFVFVFTGCTGDSWMTENGNGGLASADAGPSADADHHDHGGQSQDTVACTPKCSGKNCGDNGCGGQCGTCDHDEVCNAISICTPKSDGGNGTCVVRQLDGLGFTAFGNGVSSIEMAEAGWSQPVTAAANSSAMLTVGGASYFAFNAQRSDGLWAYGWDGVSASSVTKVVGNWSVDCGTGTTKLVSGPQQPTCGGSMAIGSACFWSKPGTTGVYRIVVRVK